MSRLLSTHIKIPGQWRDLWLYKNKIPPWDHLGRLPYLDVATLNKYLSHRPQPAPQMLIFRNDENWRAILTNAPCPGS
jgi:hypothetical protein